MMIVLCVANLDALTSGVNRIHDDVDDETVAAKVTRMLMMIKSAFIFL